MSSSAPPPRRIEPVHILASTAWNIVARKGLVVDSRRANVVNRFGVVEERGARAAALKHKHNMGYADCFAAELAMERGAWLVTADPEFSKVGKTLSVFTLPRHEG